MRKHNLVHVLLLSIFLYSCQQGVDFAERNNPGNELLVKTVNKSAGDSVITHYIYDHARRLVREKREGFRNGSNVGNDILLVRNSAGILTKMIEKAPYLLASGVDSVLTEYVYNNTLKRYTHCIITTQQQSVSVRDSIVFIYNSAGKIIVDDHFQYVSINPHIARYRQEYVYSAAGNVDSVKMVDQDPVTGEYTMSFYVAYTYDNKVNPLQMGNDALLITRPEFTGPNNEVSTAVVTLYSPSSNYSYSKVLAYKINGKPETGVMTRLPEGTSTNLIYYYQ